MTELESVLLAARLVSVSVALLLGPGMLLLAALRTRCRWPDYLVLAFSLSYCWIFVLSVIVPLFGLNVDGAVVLTLILLLALAAAEWRRGARPPRRRIEPLDVLLVAVITTSAIAGWVIEPSFTGEEALDLISISRFADGGAISFANTSLFPETRPVYLFQPYQLALGIASRWSGTDPLVTFIKFRAVLVPLALIVLFSLVRRMTLSRADAVAAFLVILAFVAFDFDTWELHSLFPLVRRGGVGAGLCAPAILFLALTATRAAAPSEGAIRRIAFWTAPVMAVASLATHPLEVFTVLIFVSGMTLVIVARLDRHADSTRAAALWLLLAAAAGSYVALQTRLVPYVAEYEADDKRQLRRDLADLMANPIAAVAGDPWPAADVMARTIPSTPAIVFGILALPVAALRAPATAAMLAAGTVPLALMFAMPAGFILLTVVTSVETVRDVNAYFGLLGVIALALGVVSAAHLLLGAALVRSGGFRQLVIVAFVMSICVLLVVTLGGAAARAVASAAIVRPAVVLSSAAVAAVLTLVIAGWRRNPLVGAAPFPRGVAFLSMCLSMPFLIPESAIGGVFTKRQPVDVVTRIREARTVPSVVDWPHYYERLRTTIAPSLPVPRVVVDELRRRIPPRQVVLADPRYSCALVVLLDAYCINPASIYGHYFQPAANYFRDYVTMRDELPQHPFFNATPTLSDAERSLIPKYGVAYVLTDPSFDALIGEKLAAGSEPPTLESSVDGYRLYRLTSPAAKTPDR